MKKGKNLRAENKQYNILIKHMKIDKSNFCPKGIFIYVLMTETNLG